MRENGQWTYFNGPLCECECECHEADRRRGEPPGERKGEERDEGTEHWAAATGQNYLLRAWYIQYVRFTRMYVRVRYKHTYRTVRGLTGSRKVGL